MSTHTSAQIQLLVCGAAEWEEWQAAKLKDAEESQQDTEPAVKKKQKVDFSRMSGDEYMRYCDSMRL